MIWHSDMLFQVYSQRFTLIIDIQAWGSNLLSKITESLHTALASPRAQTLGSQGFKETLAQVISSTVVYVTF